MSVYDNECESATQDIPGEIIEKLRAEIVSRSLVLSGQQRADDGSYSAMAGIFFASELKLILELRLDPDIAALSVGESLAQAEIYASWFLEKIGLPMSVRIVPAAKKVAHAAG